jgi:hypothetical protein
MQQTPQMKIFFSSSGSQRQRSEQVLAAFRKS